MNIFAVLLWIELTLLCWRELSQLYGERRSPWMSQGSHFSVTVALPKCALLSLLASLWAELEPEHSHCKGLSWQRIRKEKLTTQETSVDNRILSCSPFQMLSSALHLFGSAYSTVLSMETGINT